MTTMKNKWVFLKRRCPWVLSLIGVVIFSFPSLAAEIEQQVLSQIYSESHLGIGQMQQSSLGFAHNVGSLLFLDLKYHQPLAVWDFGLRTAASGIQNGGPGFDFFRLGLGPIISVYLSEGTSISLGAGYFKETGIEHRDDNILYSAKGFYGQIGWQKRLWDLRRASLYFGGFLTSFQGQLVSRGNAMLISRFPVIVDQNYHRGLEKGVTLSLRVGL